MRELSLFSGAGGGLLATHHLLGWETVGYVEFDDYCQRVLRARIDDGYLTEAPIFGDIRAFLGEGYAESYSGLVDVVSGGFPCQPFSCAGAGRAEADERNMWPETLAVINAVRPRYVYLENVPAVLAKPYCRTIFGQLAESGYDCRWRVLSGADLGAPYLRERLWIYGELDSESQPTGAEHVGQASELPQIACDPDRNELRQQSRRRSRARWPRALQPGANGETEDATNTVGAGPQRATRASIQGREHGFARITWWDAEPDVVRLVSRIPHRVERIEALGNCQVPAVAARAWEMLM